MGNWLVKSGPCGQFCIWMAILFLREMDKPFIQRAAGGFSFEGYWPTVHFFFSPQLLEELIVRKADCFQGVAIFLQGNV